MKGLISKKLNNRGMSLIEILVTVAIIALIAVPLLDSFMNAMQINTSARLIQNGTAVASDTAELFKVFDTEALAEAYEAEGVLVTIDEATGIYNFTGIPVSGADGESFLVDVELDPTVYRAPKDIEDAETENGDGKLPVNDVNVPVFSGLYGSDCIMLYRQYAGADDMLKDLFAGKLTDDILADINGAERENIKKSATVNIECDYDAAREKYNYRVSLVITYVYDNITSVSVTKSLEKSYAGDEIHNIYMICPVFDRYTTTQLGEGFYYSTDEIKLNYTYDGEPQYKHDMYFYIAEQDMSNLGYDETKRERINPRCLVVNGVQYTEYNNEENSLKVYTNIGDKDTAFDNKYSLTYGDYNTGTALYEMRVTVRVEGREGTVTTFTTSK